MRPDLDSGDIVYDQCNNSNFQDRPETIQYKSALAATRVIEGTSKENLYSG